MITTAQLCTLIKKNLQKYVEVQLCLKGGYATHFIFYDGEKLYDEGIDGEERKINFCTFMEDYKLARWNLVQIV